MQRDGVRLSVSSDHVAREELRAGGEQGDRVGRLSQGGDGQPRHGEGLPHGRQRDGGQNGELLGLQGGLLVDGGRQEGGGGGGPLEARPLGGSLSGSFVFDRLRAREKSSQLLLLPLFLQLDLQVCRDTSRDNQRRVSLKTRLLLGSKKDQINTIMFLSEVS